MYWIIFLSLYLCKSNAQLTPPREAVCVGQQVVFTCQQSGTISSWSVNLPGGAISNPAPSSLAGTVLMFRNDPGFWFEIHILSSSSNSSVVSELRVTAVRPLNGVTVECEGGNGTLVSTIQISSVDPPAAPSGVMTTADQSQFTSSTASITLTWSASSGADNYTIMVTPLLPSGQSLVSTTTTSLQLIVLYNEEYSINITAQNCAGNSSTNVSLTVAGCGPPSPLANGSISEYSSGAVGAMLTFQCDTGYMPQEEVTSTCLSNSSWVPTLKCQVVDCGDPLDVDHRVTIDPFNNTKFGALITFHCEESNDSMTAVCGSDGEWTPNVPSQCDDGSDTSGNCDTLSTRGQVIIAVTVTAIVCSLVFLLLGMFLGSLIHYCIVRHKGQIIKSSPGPPAASAAVIYEEVSPDSHTGRKKDIELNENVAYGPVTK